jgi:aryl-alcohol dehydrogenase-like predicted oxidoreductase
LGEAGRKKLAQFHQLAKDAGQLPANLALAWTLANPAVTAPIIGPRTVEQLNEVLPVPEIEIGTDLLAALDQVFPGPGDPSTGANPGSQAATAPWAYAW